MERVGHYRLEERIGAGGMGEVFRARDLALGRLAAVKLMLPGGDPSLRDRLLREVQHSARLQHPGIATFFDGGIEGGRAWLAVEYVAGETLRARLQRGPFPLPDALALGIALLEALAHAHAAGVLHRDLKPENVMLRSDGQVKLLDFGLARLTSAAADGETIQQLTTAGLVVGTVGYMPPEQLRGDGVDVRADLFAVGAILHECLSGQPAFPGSSAVERIAAVLSGERPVLPAPVPPGLSGLIARSLAREPHERPSAAAEFLRELRAVGEHGDQDGLREQQEAMSLDPSLHKAPYFAATILLDLENAPEALPLAQLAVRVNQTYPYGWLVVGIAHLRLDQFDEARYCFEQGAAAETAPDAPVVGADTSVAEVKRRCGDAAAARTCALRALERIEAMDHMYRDTHRGAFLVTPGRCALDAGDLEGAAAAFGQAAAHLRGRPNALGGGHLLVQALAGGAIAESRLDLLDEALALFRDRDRLNFSWAFLATSIDSLVQLAESARALGHEQASSLVAAAWHGATPWERNRLNGNGAS